jgi:hypothetical protein
MEELMDSWPEYVDHAFRAVSYGGQYEQALDSFAQRWGGLDVEAFTHALEKGSSEEKALALFALSYSDAPQAQTALYAHLEASEPMERWASALCLGERKDERGLPVLTSLLEEFLPPRMHPLEREGGLYHFWRMKAASLLGEWERSDLAPILRHALDKAWRIEQADQADRKHVWHSYQDELVYALGRLEAFGALAGFSLPIPRLQVWIVLLSCGSLQARMHYGDLLTQMQMNQELKEKVAKVLEQRFGLSAEEQTSYIENYADAYFRRMEWG